MIVSGQCGKRMLGILRGLTLVPLYVDHECILAGISVVSKLGAPRVEWYSFFFEYTTNVEYK